MDSTAGLTVDVVLSSRRETLHLAPVIHALRADRNCRVRVVVIKTQRSDVDETLDSLSLRADILLNIHGAQKNSGTYFGEINVLLAELWAQRQTDFLLSFGHSGATFAAAVAAFQNNVSIAHLDDLGGLHPYRHLPRQAQQSCRSIAILSQLHFTVSNEAKKILLHEGISEENIFSVGSTLGDSASQIRRQLNSQSFVAELFINGFSTLGDRILHGQFFYVEIESEKSLAILAEVLPYYAVSRNFPVPVLHIQNKTLLERIESDKAYQATCKISHLRHLQRCALLLKASLVITDSEDTLEESVAFGTMGILLREQTLRADLISSGLASVAPQGCELVIAQIDRYLQQSRSRNSLGENSALPAAEGGAATKIVRAITNRTSESVRRGKTSLLSRQAG
ncbi:MAG: hypothetical protein RLZZ488_2496 [Pseudomonadota bacterium]|jgi:UDP-N-acetylglucosamine 2-epimerase (non-hydrolysing)